MKSHREFRAVFKNSITESLRVLTFPLSMITALNLLVSKRISFWILCWSISNIILLDKYDKYGAALVTSIYKQLYEIGLSQSERIADKSFDMNGMSSICQSSLKSTSSSSLKK